MNPKACTRIAVAVRGKGGGQLRLTLEKQTVTLTLPERDDEWFHYDRHELDGSVPEGALALRADLTGGSLSGLLVWAL